MLGEGTGIKKENEYTDMLESTCRENLGERIKIGVPT